MTLNLRKGCLIVVADSLQFEINTLNVLKNRSTLFVSTLLGHMFGASVYLADVIFVGNGIGAEALAAANIGTPLFLISTGLGVLAIKKKRKTATANGSFRVSGKRTKILLHIIQAYAL